MAYTVINFKTKKELKEALAASESGERIEVYLPGPFGPKVRDGFVSLEGPHYPAPHRWYASATIKDGYIVGGVK